MPNSERLSQTCLYYKNTLFTYNKNDKLCNCLSTETFFPESLFSKGGSVHQISKFWTVNSKPHIHRRLKWIVILFFIFYCFQGHWDFNITSHFSTHFNCKIISFTFEYQIHIITIHYAVNKDLYRKWSPQLTSKINKLSRQITSQTLVLHKCPPSPSSAAGDIIKQKTTSIHNKNIVEYGNRLYTICKQWTQSMNRTREVTLTSTGPWDKRRWKSSNTYIQKSLYNKTCAFRPPF